MRKITFSNSYRAKQKAKAENKRNRGEGKKEDKTANLVGFVLGFWGV